MFCYIFWTCAEEEEAKKIIRLLLEKKWVACASFFPVQSLFEWKGKVEEEKEIKVILKSKKELFSSVAKLIQEKCSYDVAEILQVPIEEGNPSYLSWMQETLS